MVGGATVGGVMVGRATVGGVMVGGDWRRFTTAKQKRRRIVRRRFGLAVGGGLMARVGNH